MPWQGLQAQRNRLRKERSKLEPDIEPAQRFYETITLNTLHGHVFSPAQRQEIDPLLKASKKLLKRVAEIDARLVKIHKEGAVIKRHCFASDAEIRAEVPKYEKELDDAAAAGNEIHDESNEGR